MSGPDTIIYAANEIARELPEHVTNREKLNFFLGQLTTLKASLGHFFGGERNAAMGEALIDRHIDTINAILAR